ncbi:GNAT family N-acetyltransferase [Erwinia psidii]|uniref:GNAT family N-acetyltransferase n=1 Tax=Erwinia psidii TaxID=69224 RepID=UPI00226B05A6|nr:GNAT family N-acetyltransferase [Erwinia psidii]MCX8964618.1 GNAT family N-acetyltransferase [Erwinia psidii]
MRDLSYQRLDTDQAQNELPSLLHVLGGCVEEGASVGFISMDPQPMRQFWLGAIDSLASGEKQLLVARQNGTVVGTVIVARVMTPNGQHRAEICKLLVHPDARRQGIARELLKRAEDLAKAAGVTLLVLDTRSGDVAEQLYLTEGWQMSGSIPAYALSTEGALDATTVMFKQLAPV